MTPLQAMDTIARHNRNDWDIVDNAIQRLHPTAIAWGVHAESGDVWLLNPDRSRRWLNDAELIALAQHLDAEPRDP